MLSADWQMNYEELESKETIRTVNETWRDVFGLCVTCWTLVTKKISSLVFDLEYYKIIQTIIKTGVWRSYTIYGLEKITPWSWIENQHCPEIKYVIRQVLKIKTSIYRTS